ncbi:MAG TPA: AmpG family muropeptide MFS transporter [Myxococcota bacterium]|nr:AmpG family muropeptide MFS transporter [Myxococcota bacterium]
MRPREVLAAYRNPRQLTVLAMGFASGLPLALTGASLQVWLTRAGVSLKDVGLFALVGFAYSLKFLWSPLLDALAVPWLGARLGQRRAWLVLLGLGLMGAIAALGHTDPALEPWRTAGLAALVAFLSASQDIVIDAYRIELLTKEEQSAGAAATQWGYRLGMIASGAFALSLAQHYGWPLSYLAMAALAGVGVVTALVSPEPEHLRGRSDSFLASAVIEPFREFLSRPGAWLLLVFMLVYRMGDALSGGMASPFYVRLGFSNDEIASVAKVFGVIASMAGIAAGGAFAFRLGVSRALVAAGVVHALGNLAFIVQAYAGHDLRALTLTIFVENFTGGLVSAAFVGYLSTLCHPSFTATQFALFTSLTAVPRNFLASGAGWLAEQLGWPAFFAAAFVAALPGIALAVWLDGGMGGQSFRRQSSNAPKLSSNS